MSLRTHLRLLLIGTVAWLVFWVLGLPSYYQQYSTTTMLWFDGLLLIVLVPVFLRMLRRVRASRRIGFSLWLAFYLTVPLAIYDWLYCGVILEHGLSFLALYWYATVYYVIPWLVLPACAVWLNRFGFSPADSHRVAPTD